MILLHNLGICVVIILLGLVITLRDTVSKLDYFTTIGSARLYGPDSRVDCMALSDVELVSVHEPYIMKLGDVPGILG